MTVARTRAPQRDLAIDVATRFFHDSVTATGMQYVKGIWKYGREWTQSGDWASLFVFRHALLDMFEAMSVPSTPA